MLGLTKQFAFLIPGHLQGRWIHKGRLSVKIQPIDSFSCRSQKTLIEHREFVLFICDLLPCNSHGNALGHHGQTFERELRQRVSSK